MSRDTLVSQLYRWSALNKERYDERGRGGPLLHVRGQGLHGEPTRLRADGPARAGAGRGEGLRNRPGEIPREPAQVPGADGG